MSLAAQPFPTYPLPRVLFVSNLFPSSAEPGRGVFNLDQLRALREYGVEATVIAPRAWLFGARTRYMARAGQAPDREEIDGFPVEHPRAPYVPFWRGALNGVLYGLAVRRACESAVRLFAPDVLWGSFGFPDAVGLARVARRLGLPFVATVHGSDVNVSFRMPARRRAMLAALGSARFVFSRSARMRQELVEAGLDPDRVITVYNGIDRKAFRPRPRREAALSLGVDPDRRRVVFVGNLVPLKGVDELLQAHRVVWAATHAELVFVGDGELEPHLRALARAYGLAEAVRFAGREPRPRVALWMAASDVVALPSRSEGVPNVVLEALACGRPVVATHVGGVPEVHPGEKAGALVPPRAPGEIAGALLHVLRRRWSERDLTAHVRRFTWEASAARTIEVLRALETEAGFGRWAEPYNEARRSEERPTMPGLVGRSEAWPARE